MPDSVKLPEAVETALNEAIDAVADETRREGAGYSERQFREAIDNTQATIGTLRAEIAKLVAERDAMREDAEKWRNATAATGNPDAQRELAQFAELLRKLGNARSRRDKMRAAISHACGIIERGDQRLLASDGPAHRCPPELSLNEWRSLYMTLDAARKAGGGDGA